MPNLLASSPPAGPKTPSTSNLPDADAACRSLVRPSVSARATQAAKSPAESAAIASACIRERSCDTRCWFGRGLVSHSVGLSSRPPALRGPGRKYGTSVSWWSQQLVSRIGVPDHAPQRPLDDRCLRARHLVWQVERHCGRVDRAGGWIRHEELDVGEAGDAVPPLEVGVLGWKK